MKITFKSSPASIKNRILREIAKSRGVGRTCDEIEKKFKFHHATTSTRILELRCAGLINFKYMVRPTRSGKMAQVYVASGRGNRKI